MATSAFDTLTYARRLIAAGVSEEQATIQAEVLAEALRVNRDTLATKDYLDVRLSDFDSKLERRFGAVDARFAKIDVKLTEINGKFTLIFWMLGIVIASTTIPQLITLFAG